MLHWLSFADPDLPQGSQFLGAAIVEAPEFLAAVMTAHALGCNPGGECQGIELPEGVMIPLDHVGRLLSKAEVTELEAKRA